MRVIRDRAKGVDLDEFRARQLFARLATASARGPRSSPVRFPWENGCVRIIGSRRFDASPARLEREPRCASGVGDDDRAAALAPAPPTGYPSGTPNSQYAEQALGVSSLQAGFVRTYNCLCPVGYLQLAEDAADVIAHRLGTQHEPLGDCLVVHAPGHQPQHAALALRKLGEEDRAPSGTRREEGHHPCRDRRAEDRLSMPDRQDRAHDLDAVGRVPWWPDDRSEVTLHRILVHMIAETNRHAGHADIIRELIDGAVGLRDGNDNMPPVDREWWEGYRSRLERVAREIGGDVVHNPPHGSV